MILYTRYYDDGGIGKQEQKPYVVANDSLMKSIHGFEIIIDIMYYIL